MPATRKFCHDIFGSKMFMAKDSRSGNYKSIVSMPPRDEGTPTIPSMSIFRKLEEMATSTDTVRIVVAIIASKSSTILSSSFSRRGRSFHGAYTFIHCFKSRERDRTLRKVFITRESSHRQPRYRVCAATNPIWRRELQEGLFAKLSPNRRPQKIDTWRNENNNLLH